jgi:hypothetical protein
LVASLLAVTAGGGGGSCDPNKEYQRSIKKKLESIHHSPIA